MSNHEERVVVDTVHVFMAASRLKDGQENKCVRQVIKAGEEELDLRILKAKLKEMGGIWRIYKTVNARDVHKALKILQHQLIDHPEVASYADSAWRTALLQVQCAVDKKFMLDVDTKDVEEYQKVLLMAAGYLIRSTPTPNGWHVITKPFDTREVCALGYVTLLRDGYEFVEKVGE